jgi:hypothetical protein
MESLISDIPAGNRKTGNLFLQCILWPPILQAAADKLCATSGLCRLDTCMAFEDHWPSCAPIGAPRKAPDSSVPACDAPRWSVPPCDVPGWYMPPSEVPILSVPACGPLAVVCAYLRRPWLLYAVRPLAYARL